VGCWRVEREAMGLGFGAGGETVRLENGDGGGDGDFFALLCGHHITTNALIGN
jgi:hypothetical protein